MKPNHFLQSPAWRKLQQALGNEVIEKATSDYSYLAIIEHGRSSHRLYCPYGPVVNSVKGLKAALSSLEKEAKARKLDFVRIEPIFAGLTKAELSKLGYRQANRDVQPRCTIVNDIDKDTEDIMADLSQTARRYSRKCDKAGITYRVSYDPTEIVLFNNLIHQVSKRTGMIPHSDTYFEKYATTLFPGHDAGLLLAELDGKTIAAIIFNQFNGTFYYTHAANATDHRQLSPAVGLGTYALKFAHSNGGKLFDWYGVAPADQMDQPRWKSWCGFTRFKESYGGDRVNYLGTWEKPLRPARYFFWRYASPRLHKIAKNSFYICNFT